MFYGAQSKLIIQKIQEISHVNIKTLLRVLNNDKRMFAQKYFQETLM